MVKIVVYPAIDLPPINELSAPRPVSVTHAASCLHHVCGKVS